MRWPTWHVKTIFLEENDNVVNVSPDVSVQEDGSFLIADGREARIRVYDPEGGLVTQFGRRGEGPGELGLPLEAMRRPDGSLVIVDLSRGILRFDSSGTRLIRGARPPIRPLYTAEPLGNDEFLVAGLRRGSADPRPLMHVWHAQADSVSSSFFPTPGDSLTKLAARNFGWADFAHRGDIIAAIAAFADTVYLFDRLGSDLGEVARRRHVPCAILAAARHRQRVEPAPHRLERPSLLRPAQHAEPADDARRPALLRGPEFPHAELSGPSCGCVEGVLGCVSALWGATFVSASATAGTA